MNRKEILHGEISRILYLLGHSPDEMNYITFRMVEAYEKALKEVREKDGLGSQNT